MHLIQSNPNMKGNKVATKTTRTHRPVPFAKIAKMWGLGKSYEAMAKAIDRYSPKSEDPTKPVRAIVSRMLNLGYTDTKTGKHVILSPRDGMRAIGVGKKAKASGGKTKQKIAKLVAKQKGKVGRKPGNLPIVVALAEGGNLIRLSIGKRMVGLGNLKKSMPSIINLLDKTGFSVVPKLTPAAASKAVEDTVDASKQEDILDLGTSKTTGTNEAESTGSESTVAA